MTTSWSSIHLSHCLTNTNKPLPLSIKASQSTGLQKLIEVKTGGPQLVTYAPVTAARRQSDEVTPRQLRKCTKELKEHVELVAGKSNEALLCQVSHMVKSFDEKECETILKNFKTTVSIPASHLAAMKSTLNLSWNTTREIKRWLKTFKVQLASEGKARDVTKELIGMGLCAEEIPASILKGKKIVVELRAWCYIYNLVRYVLKYLNDLKSTGLLYNDHPFIPADEVHLKFGGDHGGGSFKTSFQVANVNNPNQPSNTVVFSVMEAKDLWSNLVIVFRTF